MTKLGDERFFVVVTDTMHRHAETWMKRHIPDGAQVSVTDVTSGYCQINVQGPKSRALLQTLTTADLSNEAFPFRAAREIDIGYARVLCVRITYLGELGYELYIPSEQATHVYDRLIEAGTRFDLRHAGLKALASLRMEKGYRDYGHDIDNTDNPFETGLGFFVDFDKPGGFIGRDAALKQKAKGTPTRRLVSVLVKDPEPMLFHAEVVLRDGKPMRLCARRLLRPHARRGGRPRHDRGRRARSTRPGCAPAAGRWTSPARAIRPRCRCGPSTIPR